MKPKLTIYDLERIQAAAAMMQANMAADWTIAGLAFELKMTDKKLKAGFKALYEMGVHTYLRKVRIDRIKEMLVTDKATRLILIETGFKTESGLSKTFKKVVGVTPGEFKNNPNLWDDACRNMYQNRMRSQNRNPFTDNN